MENTQNKGRRGMDMLHGSIADKLFLFAMPIGLMGLFEQLFNSADVVILGRFVGKSAMAAVGNNMPVIGILVMLLMGISLGANVTIAQYLGARRDDKVERTVQTAILMSFGLGALLAVIGELIVYPAFWVLEVPPDVYDMAEQYLRIFLLGLPFCRCITSRRPSSAAAAMARRRCTAWSQPISSISSSTCCRSWSLISAWPASSGRQLWPLPSIRSSSWPCCAGRRTASDWNATTCAFPGKNCITSSASACLPASRAWSLPCPMSSSNRP